MSSASTPVERPRGAAQVQTEAIPDDPEFARRVRWIEWDSGWRGSGLRVGDRIVGDQGESYTAETDKHGAALGAYGEVQRWEQFGLAAGDAVVVTVERAGQRATLTGQLVETQTYRNADGKLLLGEGGPVRYDRDGFDYDWQAWYNQFQDLAKSVLAGWDYTLAYDTGKLRDQIEPFRVRVEFLEKTYPGAFAHAAREDFDAMLAMVAGEPRELHQADLLYRELGEQRAAQVALAADAAYRAMLVELTGKTVPEPFPAPDPFAEDIRDWVGKIVRLPEIGDRELVLEVKRSWYRVGGSRGLYLIDRQAESMQALYAGLSKYIEQVHPGLRQRRLAFIGEVEPTPALVSDVRGRTEVGLRARPTGTLVTDADEPARRVFVDLRPEAAGREPFAGADGLASLGRPALDPSAGPGDALRTFFEYLKLSDFEAWKACFATWKVREWFQADSSYLYVDLDWNTVDDRDAMSQWDRGRQHVLDDVYAVEVAQVGPVKVVYDAAQQPAAATGAGPQRVEEVRVRINHIGSIDGDYRTFARYDLHRTWTLQRLDAGPWRVVSPWSL
jgi:hypothetical protein